MNTHSSNNSTEDETPDIQDLIIEYKESHPLCTNSEIRSYLIDKLEKIYSIGIVDSYPLADAAIKNNMLHYPFR